MSVAIGSSSLSGAAGSHPSRAVLDAEIARCKKQLSDSVNCASAKTLEGKAHIQELSNKISAAQQQVKQIAVEKPAANDATAPTTITISTTYTNTGVVEQSSGPEQGDRVNVFA